MFWNIILGALADNVGSTALFPLCLSPLALEAYYADFVERGEDPIMSISGYQWLSVCVALMVIPGTLITPWVFGKVGPSGGCVFGNVCTGILTIVLLLIGNASATVLGFSFFVIAMYSGFPLTVVSQLSTGPMLDIIAPADKIGYCQGMNNTVMNFGMAVAPWIFGLLADQIGTNPAIWIGVGVSFLAGVINAPLMFRGGLGAPKKPEPLTRRPLRDEDEVLVRKAMNGEFVDPAILADLNYKRAEDGLPVLMPVVKPYNEDKDSLDELHKYAHAGFLARRDLNDELLSRLQEEEMQSQLPELCAKFNTSLQGDSETVDETYKALGSWFADYLRANGYHAQTQPLTIKHLVLAAFPSLSDGEDITPENIEQTLINERRLANRYLDLDSGRRSQYALTKLLGEHGNQVGYYS